MIRQGDVYYAWATDPTVRGAGTCGGFVTGILIHLLESCTVDAVIGVRTGADIYDATLAIMETPEAVRSSAGTLYCGTLLVTKLLIRYLEGNAGKKLAVVVKGCDAKAIIEMSKRNRIDLDDILLIGLTCSGTISPVNAREMASHMFGINPGDVTGIELSQGQCILRHSGGEKGIPIEDLEKEGYGRHPCCQRCLTRVPRQCDLVCGSWGVTGEYAGNTTFIEVCSKKGAETLQKAARAGAVGIEPPGEKAIEIRKQVEEAMMKLSRNNRAAQFYEAGYGQQLLDRMMTEMSRCIKCYQCSEACPLCMCRECQTKKPWLVKPGQVPPPFMFHLIRISHIADSCVNCGQCEDRCPMEIRNSLFMNRLQDELELMFGYHPGERAGRPVVARVNELEEWEHHYSGISGREYPFFPEKRSR